MSRTNSYNFCFINSEDRNSAIRTVTRYGLDGSGFENRWGRDFRTRPYQHRGPPNVL